MHFIPRHRRNLMRHLLLIEGGEPQGGEGEPPAGQNTHGEGDNAKNTTTDNAKEFSHALAARVEEEKRNSKPDTPDTTNTRPKPPNTTPAKATTPRSSKRPTRRSNR